MLCLQCSPSTQRYLLNVLAIINELLYDEYLQPLTMLTVQNCCFPSQADLTSEGDPPASALQVLGLQT